MLVHNSHQLDRVIGIGERLAEVLLALSPPTEVFCLQVSLICLRIRAAQVRSNRMPVAPQQFQSQRLGRGLGNVILYAEDILNLPIVRLRPKLKTIVRLD